MTVSLLHVPHALNHVSHGMIDPDAYRNTGFKPTFDGPTVSISQNSFEKATLAMVQNNSTKMSFV